MANRNSEIWFIHHDVLKAFASGVLSAPTDLRIATAELPEHTALACWRLLYLLLSLYSMGFEPAIEFK